MPKNENAPYDVISTNDKFEERFYPAQKWATTVANTNSNNLFWKCYGYINGKNETGTKISMTTPVTYDMAKCGKTFTSKSMSFYVPAKHQEDTPKPVGDEVEIEERPAMTVFVKTYGGFSNDSKTTENAEILMNDLREANHKFKDGQFYYAGYDPPFKLFGRRNEIWILKDEN